MSVFPKFVNNEGEVLKIVVGRTPNLVTHKVPARSLDLSDSQAKG